jgi:SAM-dependent methyltransferase
MNPKMNQCNACFSDDVSTLLSSERDSSLTSHLKIIPRRLEVDFCGKCGHLMTPPLPDLDTFYESEYNILTQSSEEDQFYAIKDGVPVYRYDHQAKTLLDLLPLPQGAKILDYGSGKGTTLRKAKATRPDLDVHLFDVSEAYRPFWREFMDDAKTASHDIPEAWRGSFDAAVSFYVLEHVEHPVEMLKNVKSLLKDGGIFYWIVPDVSKNPCDMIVADHINHFCPGSIRAVAASAGLSVVSIDDASHNSAYICIMKNEAAAAQDAPAFDVAKHRAELEKTAKFWTAADEKIAANEAGIPAGSGIAIYGSGVYGAYILNTLKSPQRVSVFLDMDKFKQKQPCLGLPVLAPDKLPPEITHVFVGLNPRIAKQAMESVQGWDGRDLRFYYL